MNENNLPDSEELFRTGLDSEQPYLVSPSVVEDVLRGFLSKVVELRGKYLQDVSVDPEPQIDALCKAMQATFYGQDQAFKPSVTWNTPDQLGKYLAVTLNLGGEPVDAVQRLGHRIVADFMDAYVPYEDDSMSDEQFTEAVNFIVEMYTHALCGIPYSVE